MQFDDLYTYLGEMHDSQYHGEGLLRFPDGSSLQSNFYRNKLSGQGVYTDVQGRRWVGNFNPFGTSRGGLSLDASSALRVSFSDPDPDSDFLTVEDFPELTPEVREAIEESSPRLANLLRMPPMFAMQRRSHQAVKDEGTSAAV